MSDAVKELYDRGRQLFEECNYVEAEGLLDEVARLKPEYADVFNKLGVIANLDGRLDLAVARFEEALKLNPSYAEAAMNLAITLNETGQTERAREVLTAGAESRPTVVTDGHCGLSDHFIAGKLANEHYKLGRLYIENQLIDEAIEEFAKAIHLRPGLPDVHVKMGMALRQKGRPVEAVESFQKAKAANATYAPAYIQLGISHYTSGRLAEARTEWEQALKVSPENREARSLISLLGDKA